MSLISSLNLSVHMDFDGQRKAENIARIIITLGGVFGFIWGYIEQKFSYTVYSLGVGFLIAAFLTLPPWPVYRRKPLSWQKVKEDSQQKKKK